MKKRSTGFVRPDDPIPQPPESASPQLVTPLSSLVWEWVDVAKINDRLAKSTRDPANVAIALARAGVLRMCARELSELLLANSYLDRLGRGE
jgi:hypothetical protein